MRLQLLALLAGLCPLGCAGGVPPPLMEETHEAEVQRCERESLRQTPGMWGRLGVDIRTDANGRASSLEPHLVRGTLTDAYQTCVLTALQNERYQPNVWFARVFDVPSK